MSERLTVGGVSLRRPGRILSQLRQLSPVGRRAIVAAAFIATVLAVGTVGYVFLGLSLLDAAYQTAITITTVGFGEVTPDGSDPTGAYRAFTLVLVLTGVGTVVFATTVFVESMVENRLGIRKGRRMQHQIDNVEGHLIVCGYGRVGKAVVARSMEFGQSPVIIEASERLVEDCGHLYVVGDASRNDVLLKAGVERAAALVGALPTDAGNLFLAVSARRFNPGLRIVTRANASESAEKLRTIDIETVVEPYQIAGARLATAAIRPHTSDYLDQVFSSEATGVELIEVTISANSDLVGLSEAEACTPGAIPVAVRRSDSPDFVTASQSHVPLAPGDVLIALGDRSAADLLQARADGVGPRRD